MIGLASIAVLVTVSWLTMKTVVAEQRAYSALVGLTLVLAANDDTLARGAGASPCTLLYVEDDRPSTELMTDLIDTAAGHRLVTAPTGAQGIALAARHRPDIVLLDINLPDMSGFDVLAAIRVQGGGHDIPVIAISASARAEDVERGLAAGFDGYMPKPLRVAEFLCVLDQMMAKKPCASRTDEATTSLGAPLVVTP